MFTLAQSSHRHPSHRGPRSAGNLAVALIAGACALSLAPARVALAQQPAASPPANDDKYLYIGAITADNVYVRAGHSDSYYPFFKVNRGDLVKVTEERFGYVRVSMVGPAFRDAYGYIKHPKGDTSKLRIDAASNIATTLGRVDILAPNLDVGGEPKDSWKTLVRLPADQTVTVLGSSELGNDVIYKVSLPASASGWVSAQFVPHASAEDAEIFKQILAGKIEAPKPSPAPTPEETLGTQDAVAQAPANTNDAAPAQQQPQQPTQTPEAGELDSLASTPPEEAPATTTQPEAPRLPTLEDLEQRFNQLRTEPIETAEVMPLRDLYKELADRNTGTGITERRIARACKARIEQLEVWSELQTKRQEVMAARERMKATGEQTDAARAALERSAEYTAVGRIASSTIYDGASLPKLFRIQDPATGRTIAYLKPDPDYAMANRIDMIVGVVGDKAYDESLRLNIITPRRIEALSPVKATKTGDAEKSGSTGAGGAGGAGGTSGSEDK